MALWQWLCGLFTWVTDQSLSVFADTKARRRFLSCTDHRVIINSVRKYNFLINLCNQQWQHGIYRFYYLSLIFGYQHQRRLGNIATEVPVECQRDSSSLSPILRLRSFPRYSDKKHYRLVNWYPSFAAIPTTNVLDSVCFRTSVYCVLITHNWCGGLGLFQDLGALCYKHIHLTKTNHSPEIPQHRQQ